MSGIVGGAGSKSGIIGEIGDGLIHVGTKNVIAPGESNVDVSFFSSKFISYQVYLIDLNPVNDNTSLHMQYIEQDGSVETGNYYKTIVGGGEQQSNGGRNNDQHRGAWNAGEMTIHPGGGNVGDHVSDETVSGVLHFMNPYQTAVNPSVVGRLSMIRSNGDNLQSSYFYARLGRTGTNYKGFRIYMSSGDVEKVQILVYGMRS